MSGVGALQDGDGKAEARAALEVSRTQHLLWMPKVTTSAMP